MWAWVSSVVEIDEGSIGNGAQLRSRSGFQPWKSPQSTRCRSPSISSRVLDPVTVPAAP